MSGVLAQIDGELAALAQQVHCSLVRVESGRWGAGAGTIWHPDGLVLTNAHVARRERHAIELADGQRLEARVLARDHDLDLAALAVEGAELSKTRPWADDRDRRFTCLATRTLGDGLWASVGGGGRSDRWSSDRAGRPGAGTAALWP